ncbi:hypothetical protein M1O56_03995, partial [Dehalococcoidia bacterium]|nr:hypothetical protein [Dehalococcoidia bacterium]
MKKPSYALSLLMALALALTGMAPVLASPQEAARTGGFDFGLSVMPIADTVIQGEEITPVVTVTLLGELTEETVTLTADDVPDGVTVTFFPAVGEPTFFSTMKIAADPEAPPVTDHAITIIGTGGGLERTTTFTLTVEERFRFSL